MASRYTFRMLAHDVLEKTGRPMTAEEIWSTGIGYGLADLVGSSGKTPERSIQAQLYMEIKDNATSSMFVQVSKRPVLFALRGQTDTLLEVEDDYVVDDLIRDVLSSSDNALTVDEVYEAVLRELPKRLTVAGGLKRNTLVTQLNALSSSGGSGIVKMSSNPTRFALADVSAIEDAGETVALAKPMAKKRERDLHSLLTTFVAADRHFKCRTKTIRQETSRKGSKNSDKWSHPDLVGIYFPFEDYDDETVHLIETMRDNPYKVFSFEMKWELKASDLREYYFQAVSNSSWANEGYLVAPKIDDDETFLDDLARLVNAFGIGVIRLDVDNIEQSEILFPAREHERLDWATVDRLVSMNHDFRAFVRRIHGMADASQVWGDFFDKPLAPEKYDDYVRGTSVSRLLGVG